MKIASAQQNLSSSHHELERREVNERLRMWTGNPPPRSDNDSRANKTNPGNSAPATLSDTARALAQLPPPEPAAPAPAIAPPEASALAEAMEGANNDPGLALLRHMLERVFGIHIRSFKSSDLAGDHSATEAMPHGDAAATQKIDRNATGGGANWGIEYEYHAQRTEIETTRFAAEGKVMTQDGQTFEFKLSLEMTRHFSEQIDVSFRAGNAVRQKDPLIVNFAGNAAQLADLRFEIDLDDDGKNETARFTAPGSGFLVFDRNADGKITSGKELFGPTSGDGFAELALHDSDRNGWIDENDPIYAELKVWTKTADGGNQLKTLKDSNVGAISLARLATPFAIRDGANTSLGQVRSSGVYLGDDGKAGTVQQVDLAV